MKVTVKRKKNVGTLKHPPYSIVGVKKPISCIGKNQTYHAVARTQVIPRRAKKGGIMNARRKPRKSQGGTAGPGGHN